MLKILHTGDWHIGRNYDKYDPALAERLRAARLEAVDNINALAEKEGCDVIVVAGDLFDNIRPAAKLIKQVCEKLKSAPCPVLIIPGNHDYCTGSDELWQRFSAECPDNVRLLTKCEPYVTEKAVYYPCVCPARHSEENMLGWISGGENRRDSTRLHIGIAHGAIEGLSCDSERRYYYMPWAELRSCGLDLWLIGHTHIPYPAGDCISDENIFNAGTHQQTDVSNNTDGTVFVIEISDDKRIKAVKHRTGVVSFRQADIRLSHGEPLREALSQALAEIPRESTFVELNISGVAMRGDFESRAEIYNEQEKGFLFFEVNDSALEQEITADMIDEETIDGSAENKLLKRYISEPYMLNLAFDLVKSCKEGK